MTRGSLAIAAGGPAAITWPWFSTTIRCGERHDRPHDVLDQEDRDAARVDRAAELDDPLGLGRRQPGHHLVEQQQPGLGGQRARQLEPLALGQREAAGRPVGLGRRGPPGRGPRGPSGSAVAERRVRASAPTRTFSQHGEPPERLARSGRCGPGRRRQTSWGLSPASDAPSNRTSPASGARKPEIRWNSGGLARAVGPDEPDDLARRDLESVSPRHGLEPAEPLRGRSAHLEERSSSGARPIAAHAPRRAGGAGRRPGAGRARPRSAAAP